MWVRTSIFALAVGLLLTGISINVNADIYDFQDNWTYEGDGVFYLQDGATLDGQDAANWREMIDTNFGNADSFITQSDIDSYNSYMVSMGIHGQTNLFKLDGGSGGIENLASEYEGADGPVNSTLPIHIIGHIRFHFTESSQPTHTFQFTYAAYNSVDSHTNFTFVVPEGYRITEHTELDDAALSDDSRTVQGQAPLNEQVVISFKEIGVINWGPLYTVLFIALLIGTPIAMVYAKHKLDQRKAEKAKQKRPDCFRSYNSKIYKCTICSHKGECEIMTE